MVVGVAQAINKKSGNGGTFTEKDEKAKHSDDFTSEYLCYAVSRNPQILSLLCCQASTGHVGATQRDFAAYLAFCGIVLHNAQLYETSLLENKRNQLFILLDNVHLDEDLIDLHHTLLAITLILPVLLDLASLIFEEQQSLEVILKKIAATIISFMQVQKCTIFIVDEDCSVSTDVFHMECEELEKSSDALTRTPILIIKNCANPNFAISQFDETLGNLLLAVLPVHLLHMEHDANKINYMYAQYVKNTMEPLNIPDVSKDKRFPWTTENTGNVNQHELGDMESALPRSYTHSIVLVPLIFMHKKSKQNLSTYTHNITFKGLVSNSIGVCQLVNKMEENTGKVKPFNRNDEQFLEAFVIFCGLGIQNTQMYEAVERAMAKQMVTLEVGLTYSNRVLSYHASAAEEETRELQSLAAEAQDDQDAYKLRSMVLEKDHKKAAVVPSAQTLKISDFSFSDFELSDLETALCTIRMFTDLNLVQNFQMKHENLTQEYRWILSVKKNYRKNVAYHNWRHAFNTAQCMFAALKAGKIQNKLTDLEILALLIAALSHDLDHRGETAIVEEFYKYASGIYEGRRWTNNYAEQRKMQNEYAGPLVLTDSSGHEKHEVEDCSLQTCQTGLSKLLPELSWAERGLLPSKAMLMTACDLSAITKPWPIQQRIAELVATEFFDQGDRERKELNIEPTVIHLLTRQNISPKQVVNGGMYIYSPVLIPTPAFSLSKEFNKDLRLTRKGRRDTKRTMEKKNTGAMTHVSEDCFPLLDGCRKNRQKWQALAEQQEKMLINGESGQAKRN
ncbi:hypothetical protein P7K49_006785 [Saguinus oedipus]|uniref:PDEase domain-containing protein n=1 Tax=Saguinus oedipus TaxID=9490 RepID=A0ABQ9W3F5_SAGOE|nr:hypothetical protein P7K49_006785 [Saguinus oedipus]